VRYFAGKSVYINCHILKVICTKFDFGWGSAPDPTGGAYSTLPDLLAGFKGPTSRVRKDMGGRMEGMYCIDHN